MGIIDNLALEMQRSMDFFESQLHQDPVLKIKLAIKVDNLKLIVDSLQENFSIPVTPFEISLGEDSLSDNVVSYAACMSIEQQRNTS